MSHAHENQFFGIYRGEVIDNDDKNAEDKHKYLGRLRVRIDQVYGKKTQDKDCPWAWPAALVWGADEAKNPQGLFLLPPKKSTVAIIFEHGDPERPFWIGNFWGEKPGDLSPEISQLNVQDGRTGVKYPKIVTIKGPDRTDGCWFRIIGDRRLELVYKEDETFVEIDVDRKRIYLKAMAGGWNIEFEAAGDVKITAKNLVMQIAEDIRINGGGNAMIQAGGNLLCGSGGTSVFQGSEIQGAGGKASGFENHPK